MISTASASGGIVGPLLGGIIAELVGNCMTFASAGFIVLISTILVIFWVKEENFIPSKERSSVKNVIKVA